MRVTDEVAAKWAQYRADDAGLAARDLLDCREQLRRVCEAGEALLAEAGHISGDYKHWTCQVCSAEWDGQYEQHPPVRCEHVRMGAAILAARQALEQK